MRDRDRIDLVWVKPDRGLAKRMLKEPGWTVLYQDKVSVLFGRKKEGRRPSLALRLCVGFQLLSNRFRQLVG